MNTGTVTIPAKKVMWGVGKKARLFNINEEKIWIPNSLWSFEEYAEQGDPIEGSGDIKGDLTVAKWFYDKNIKSHLQP